VKRPKLRKKNPKWKRTNLKLRRKNTIPRLMRGRRRKMSRGG
jgi:hypothetical protein